MELLIMLCRVMNHKPVKVMPVEVHSIVINHGHDGTKFHSVEYGISYSLLGDII
jgi:hypothetical protein